MRRALGILALVLVVGTSASAENNSVIKYTLQVGGSNAGGPGVPFDTTNVREAGEFPIWAAGWGVITWSVRVEVSGDIDGTYVGGAANLVWDLTLKGPDGQPVGSVGTPFGLGSPITPGFYSSMMNDDAGGAFATQPACFTWVFGEGVPFGRLIDPVNFNGPNMAQFTYPSTYHYYRLPGAASPVDPATVNAPTGTLMGMRAGYVNLDWEDGTELTGVGILSDGGGVYSCFMDIGAKTPIAEGQINMVGLPSGLYTLELTPGDGNNVVWADGLSCQIGTSGAFAAPAGIVTGSTIQFMMGGEAWGWLNVSLAPAAAVIAGCTWNVDGGTAQVSGATVGPLIAGTHVIAFQAAPSWIVPPNVNVFIVPGYTTTVGPDASTTFPQMITPQGVLAESVRTHGAAGTFGIQLNTSGAGNATSEPRVDTAAGCNPMVVVTYDMALSAALADLPSVVATAAGGAPPTVGVVQVSGNQLLIPLTNSTERTCVTLTIIGVKAAASSLPAPAHTVKLVYRRGDVDGNRNVGPADINAVKAHSSIANVNATNFRYDMDCSGKTGPSDITFIKGQSAPGPTSCPLP